MRFRMLKADAEQRVVYGWASVIARGPDLGHLKLDLDTDREVIFEPDLAEMAHDFVLESRKGSDAHGPIVSRCCASLAFTRELQKALGIEKLRDPETGGLVGLVGWLVGFKIDDPTTWELVKSGDYEMFSIGGSSYLTPLPESFDLSDVGGVTAPRAGD